MISFHDVSGTWAGEDEDGVWLRLKGMEPVA